MPKRARKSVTIMEPDKTQAIGNMTERRPLTPKKINNSLGKKTRVDNCGEDVDIELTPRVIINNKVDSIGLTSVDSDEDFTLELSGSMAKDHDLDESIESMKRVSTRMHNMSVHEAWNIKEDLCECSLRSAVRKMSSSIRECAEALVISLNEKKNNN